MNIPLLIAAVLIAAIAVAHTLLGERLVIGPLLAGEVPKLGGSSRFMRRTVRYAWHLTSLIAVGFAALLFHYAKEPKQHVTAIEIVSATFLLSSLLAVIMTRGKHFSWVVFLAIGLLSWFF
jgi:hypothetical protein